jgi:hypothetical protein
MAIIQAQSVAGFGGFTSIEGQAHPLKARLRCVKVFLKK